MADNTERVFTTEVNGRKKTQIAYTPSDVVRLQFNGWTEITGTQATRVIAAAERDAKAAEKAAEKAADTTTTTAKK